MVYSGYINFPLRKGGPFMDHNLQKKGNGFALLPFAIFIVIYLGAGLFLQAQGTEMAFYQFPSVTAMFIAVVVAFCMGKGSIDSIKQSSRQILRILCSSFMAVPSFFLV